MAAIEYASEKNPTAAAPFSGTSRPAPERTGHSYSSTLQQQQRAAASYTSTLAAPSRIHPSSSTFHRHPLTSMPAPKHCLKRAHHSDSSTFKHHPQATPCTSSGTRKAPACPPNCTHHCDSSTHSGNSMPAPKHTKHFDTSTSPT